MEVNIVMRVLFVQAKCCSREVMTRNIREYQETEEVHVDPPLKEKYTLGVFLGTERFEIVDGQSLTKSFRDVKRRYKIIR